MIEGSVNDSLEAVIEVPVRGSDGRDHRVRAVVDTGFSRFLTLPHATVAEMGLEFTGISRVVLADDSETSMEAYAVTVLWDGAPTSVVAYASDTTPLVGMSLLAGHSLCIEVQHGGRVTIEAL